MFLFKASLKSKNQVNLLTTPKDIHRTRFNVENNLFLRYITFKSEATRIYW